MHESENPISQSDNPSINQSFKQPLLLMAGPLGNVLGPVTVAVALRARRTPPRRKSRIMTATKAVALPVTASQRTSRIVTGALAQATLSQRGRSTRTARCGRMTRSLALAVTGNWEKST